MTTRALRLAFFPRRSQARSRMTREDAPLLDCLEAADRDVSRGVPVKAEAVAAMKAMRRNVMVDFIVTMRYGRYITKI